jgi:hypothetical protein
MERRLRERLDALGAAPRAELLHVLMFPTSTGRTGSGRRWRNSKGPRSIMERVRGSFRAGAR